VLSLSPAVKLWFCPQPVDMRLGFDGLFALVRSRLQADPLSGHLFIFHNRTADRLKGKRPANHIERDAFQKQTASAHRSR